MCFIAQIVARIYLCQLILPHYLVASTKTATVCHRYRERCLSSVIDNCTNVNTLKAKSGEKICAVCDDSWTIEKSFDHNWLCEVQWFTSFNIIAIQLSAHWFHLPSSFADLRSLNLSRKVCDETFPLQCSDLCESGSMLYMECCLFLI